MERGARRVPWQRLSVKVSTVLAGIGRFLRRRGKKTYTATKAKLSLLLQSSGGTGKRIELAYILREISLDCNKIGGEISSLHILRREERNKALQRR